MTSGKIDRHPSSRRVRTGGPSRKGKRTFSLSAEALAYLDGLARNYPSVSEALDTLIREKQAEAEKARISASIRSYYDSIGEEERAENRAWGEFAESQFAKG